MDDLSVFDRASVYVDADGAIIYRASALGHCVGALVRARLGVTPSPPPDDMQQKFDEGHDWEERVILAGLGVDWIALDGRKLKQYGTVTTDPATGNVQVETEIRWGKAEADGGTGIKVIRCHPDAIAQHGSRMLKEGGGNAERRVVEAKFFGPDLFYETVRAVSQAEKNLGSGKQALGLGLGRSMQLAVQMHSTGLPALYIIGLKDRNKETGELGLGEVWTMEVSEPPHTLAEIKARVFEVEGYVARGEVPACPKPLDYPCPYWQEHEEHKSDRVEVKDGPLVVLLTQYQVVLEEKETVASEVDALRVKILDALKAGDDGGSVRCNGFDVDLVKSRPGNVSWSRAYKALAVKAKMQVDEDEYRGADVAEGVKIGRV